jgi:hypothetical protein
MDKTKFRIVAILCQICEAVAILRIENVRRKHDGK